MLSEAVFRIISIFSPYPIYFVSFHFVLQTRISCMDHIARQKDESALEGSCSDVIDCDV